MSSLPDVTKRGSIRRRTVGSTPTRDVLPQQLHRQQTMEERTIASQRNPEIHPPYVVISIPLILELQRPRPTKIHEVKERLVAGAGSGSLRDGPFGAGNQPCLMPPSKALTRAFTASARWVSTTGALVKRTPRGFTGVPPIRTSKWR